MVNTETKAVSYPLDLERARAAHDMVKAAISLLTDVRDDRLRNHLCALVCVSSDMRADIEREEVAK